ncbi:MAG: hypothetical protein Udaeo_10020 [Candidatus Udaeobacter sp.]|nr:MAG: hypothetical protein Udaeo_10020 [Candidatus Udaeobacter sp.]
MHSHFIFLDSVKAILVHCAHRLLSESTLILCTLKTATVESRRPAFDVCFGLCSPSRVSAFSALNLVRFQSTVVEEPVQRYQNHHREIDPPLHTIFSIGKLQDNTGDTIPTLTEMLQPVSSARVISF